MAYSAMLTSQVKKAFNILKDLAVDVVFNAKPVSDFNFATGEVVSGATSSVVTKAVITKSSKASSKTNVVSRDALFKSADVGDVTLYSSVTHDGEVWNIGETIFNDGYLVMLTLFREK